MSSVNDERMLHRAVVGCPGWSNELMKRVLHEPGGLTHDPNYPNMPPHFVHFLRARVEAAERAPAARVRKQDLRHRRVANDLQAFRGWDDRLANYTQAEDECEHGGTGSTCDAGVN